MTHSLCLVTAFINIDRGGWESIFKRSIETYIDNFLPYLDMKEEIIVFADPIIYCKLLTISKDKSHVKIIEITPDILKNIRSWSYVDIENYIMNCDSYKKLTSHRRHFPENCMPKYNIVQHCKTDFVKYVIDKELTKANYIAWTDFGFFSKKEKVPTRSFDFSKIIKDKINYCLINDFIPESSLNIMNEIKDPHEVIGGGFFIGNREKHLELNELYHRVLIEEFYKNKLVDDDQHIVLRCFFRNKDLFALHHTGWYNSYLYFQKSQE